MGYSNLGNFLGWWKFPSLEGIFSPLPLLIFFSPSWEIFLLLGIFFSLEELFSHVGDFFHLRDFSLTHLGKSFLTHLGKFPHSLGRKFLSLTCWIFSSSLEGQFLSLIWGKFFLLTRRENFSYSFGEFSLPHLGDNFYHSLGENFSHSLGGKFLPPFLPFSHLGDKFNSLTFSITLFNSSLRWSIVLPFSIHSCL